MISIRESPNCKIVIEIRIEIGIKIRIEIEIQIEIEIEIESKSTLKSKSTSKIELEIENTIQIEIKAHPDLSKANHQALFAIHHDLFILSDYILQFCNPTMRQYALPPLIRDRAINLLLRH